jgi:two-component system response regulator RegX3
MTAMPHSSPPPNGRPEPPHRPHAVPYAKLQPETIGHLRILQANGVDLDLDGYQVRVDDQPVTLPPKEFELLRVLMENAGKVMPRAELLAKVWAPDYPDDNKTLNVHILRLRKKIEADHNHPTRIRTVRGLGYIFDLGNWPPTT